MNAFHKGLLKKGCSSRTTNHCRSFPVVADLPTLLHSTLATPRNTIAASEMQACHPQYAAYLCPLLPVDISNEAQRELAKAKCI